MACEAFSLALCLDQADMQTQFLKWDASTDLLLYTIVHFRTYYRYAYSTCNSARMRTPSAGSGMTSTSLRPFTSFNFTMLWSVSSLRSCRTCKSNQTKPNQIKLNQIKSYQLAHGTCISLDTMSSLTHLRRAQQMSPPPPHTHTYKPHPPPPSNPTTPHTANRRTHFSMSSRRSYPPASPASSCRIAISRTTSLRSSERARRRARGDLHKHMHACTRTGAASSGSAERMPCPLASFRQPPSHTSPCVRSQRCTAT